MAVAGTSELSLITCCLSGFSVNTIRHLKCYGQDRTVEVVSGRLNDSGRCLGHHESRFSILAKDRHENRYGHPPTPDIRRCRRGFGGLSFSRFANEMARLLRSTSSFGRRAE